MGRGKKKSFGPPTDSSLVGEPEILDLMLVEWDKGKRMARPVWKLITLSWPLWFRVYDVIIQILL